MAERLQGVSNNKSLFVRVHAKIACDGNRFLAKDDLITQPIRRNTTVGYLRDAWEKHGGWE